ncbi:MAG: TIGR02757 family protein [Phycisphaerales bacterium]|nr:TIGR02757 family protein [Phycisphaerales bacterium]NNM25135.1 TIGR02757 family protein [Phycisphaerales bacterium]
MPRAPATSTLATERRWLEGLHRRYHHPRFITPDPLEFVHRYDEPDDREVVGLIASALAYGNVTAMRPAIGRVLDPLGARPAATIAAWTPRRVRRTYAGFRYRFTDADTLGGLLVAARRVRRTRGSLDACLATHATPTDDDAFAALGGLVDELHAAAGAPLTHLIPHPRGGSACKRLCLWLRWMVRCDAVDPGGWTGVAPSQLVMPLDTHVFQIAQRRGWTRRRTPNGAAALEVTTHLRRLCPRDPLRYDFAITRPGIRREPADI